MKLTTTFGPCGFAITWNACALAGDTSNWRSKFSKHGLLLWPASPIVADCARFRGRRGCVPPVVTAIRQRTAVPQVSSLRMVAGR